MSSDGQSSGQPLSLELAPALPATLSHIQGPLGLLGIYHASSDREVAMNPVVLVHTVNAAASAYEVRPVFERLMRERSVYAMDLPGFGNSARPDRRYTPREMTDAVHAAVAWIRRRHGEKPVHGLAVSLGSEFLARAAVEDANSFASVALVSPTAMDRSNPRRGEAGATLGNASAYRLLRWPPWRERLFSLLTTRTSIRFFLRKTFGSKNVPPGLIDYAYRTAHQPGASAAPLSFLSGYLFSADAFSLYEALRLPTWIAHGVRGDFQDYRHAQLLKQRADVVVNEFETGALPYFEQLDAFMRDFTAFMDGNGVTEVAGDR